MMQAMTSDQVTLLMMLWVACGAITGYIGYTKTGEYRPYYFIMGLLLGVIGIVIVLAEKPQRRPVQLAPGWYPDPNDRRFVRYFDGRQWTNQLSQIAP